MSIFKRFAQKPTLVKESTTRMIEHAHRVERGGPPDERMQTIGAWDSVTSVVTSKRIDLLRHVRRHPTRSIRALAIALGRDYRNVHADVQAMKAAGFLDVSKGGLRSTCDFIQIKIAV